ncbi:MAG: metal-dependent hydrolase [Methanoregula sp.]|nr:metal-dependent hydrolase [Methanoregula sp.]
MSGQSFFVDALSHALIAVILFSAAGLTELIPFAILGAVIMDADIVFSWISDRIPSLYLFTHGGITHSIAGAVVISILTYVVIILLATAGIIPTGVPAAAGVSGFAAVLAGALLHIAIDVSAIPGIPVFAPFSERKYSLGILPGPSLLLFVAAVALVMETALSMVMFSSALELFGIVVVIYFTVRVGMFLAVGVQLPGRKIPSVNPLQWLVIREDETTYRIRTYTLFHGYSEETISGKFKGTDARELFAVAQFPEVRRFMFFSYLVTAEREGQVLILSDPLREKGFLHYPMKYKRVEVKI